MATETFPCACCCDTGKTCYQEYYATWTCSTETWAGPTPDNKVCIPPGEALAAWTKVAEGETNCLYKIHVPLGGCCTENSECSSKPDGTEPTLPMGNPGDCCCCPAPPKKCFDRYVVTWQCPNFSAVTFEGHACLSTDSSGEWRRVGGDDGCKFEKLVPCGACTCCAGVGDCGGCDTLPPTDLPTAPEESCACPCASEDECEDCPCGTPTSVTIAFDGLSATNCAINTADPYYVWKVVPPSGTFTCPQDPGDPCNYLPVACNAKVLRCLNPNPEAGHNCESCEPDEDVTVACTVQALPGGAWVLTIVWNPLGGGDSDFSPPYDIEGSPEGGGTCCDSVTWTGKTSTTSGEFGALYDGTVTIIPCS